VLVLSRLSGFSLLVLLALVVRDPLPPLASVGWAAAGGMAGALGLGALYKGLAIGRSALVIPITGVIGAAIPVLFAVIVEGVLPMLQQLGLATALVGIWLVSRGHDGSDTGSSRGLPFAVLAGIGFGGFFILLGQVESVAVLTPLAIAIGAGSTITVAALLLARLRLPAPTRSPGAVLAGVLDVTGAVLYLLAIRWVRLDIAAVLGSLYPAVAVVLFRVVTQETVSRLQWVGLAVCIAAIGLIAV
jgi:drug/metabolite transporter (DMT)-like permease